MNKLQKIIDVYNDRQDEWDVEIEDNDTLIRIHVYKKELAEDVIGFYEWLFNSKYGVIQIFKLDHKRLFCKEVGSDMKHTYIESEIIDYIYGELDNGK